ncbi:MAG: hypothetical protein V1904_00825 [Bacteroidota bacterium]
MKKIAALFLCVLFLFNIMGYYTAFLIQRAQLKKEMKAYIKSDAGAENLQKLFIPVVQFAASVDFIEDNEFIYNGELYDLVKKETSDSVIILYCINDKKEQLLLETAREHFSRNHDENSSTNNNSSVLKNIIKEALPENPNFITYSVCHITQGTNYSSLIITQYIAITSPPPKT